MMRHLALLTFLIIPATAYSLTFEQQWQLAEGFFQRELYKDAIKEFEKLRQNAPTQYRQDILLRLADCYQETGEYQKALKDIEAYVKISTTEKNRRLAIIKKANLFNKSGQFENAIKTFNALPHSDIDDLWSSARYEICRIYLVQKNDPQALLEINSALETGQVTPLIKSYLLYTKALIFSRSDKASQAISTYENFLQEDPVNESGLQEQALFNLGSLHYQQGANRQAAIIFEKLITNYPDSTLTDDSTLSLARSLYNLKEFERVQKVLKKLALSDSNASFLKGQAALTTRNFKDAAKAFEVAARDPRYKPQSLYYQAIAYDYLNDWKSIKRLLAPELDNSKHLFYPDILYFYARALYREKDFATAAEYFKQAAKAATGQWSHKQNCLLELARSSEKLNAPKQAAKNWLDFAAVSQGSQKADALLRAAALQTKANDNTGARESYKKFLRQFPDHAQAFSIGIYLLRSYSTGKEEAELFFNGLPENNASLKYFALGILAYEKGRYKNAITCIEKITTDKLPDNIKPKAQVILAFSYLHSSADLKAAKTFNDIMSGDFEEHLTEAQLIAATRLLRRRNYIKAAKKASSHLSGSPSTITQAKAYNELALIELSEKQFRKATHYAEKTLTLAKLPDSQKTNALSIIAEASLENNMIAESWQAVEVALSIAKGNEESSCRLFFTHARLLLLQKKTEEALRRLGQVYILYNEQPYSPKALLLAAEIYASSKEKSNAQKLLRELQQRFPLFYTSQEAKKQLKKTKQLLK